MIGRGTMVWLSLAIAAGVGLFHVSYRVQSLEEELGRVNRDILREQETIHVLRAEWSYLNEPRRLAELSRRHLTLAPLSANQMMRIEDLPLRLPPLIAETAPLPDPGPSIQSSSIATTAEVPSTKAEPPPTSIADLIERTADQP
ncbi:MAG: cell division protein FtsL [Dongiaceae bacterium]